MAEITTLKELFKHKGYTLLFREYLVENMNGENLAFWFDVEDFKKISDNQTRKNRAKEMWEKYFYKYSKVNFFLV